MILQGQSGNSYVARTAKRELRDGSITHYSDVDATAELEISNAYIANMDGRNKFRPYLTIEGRIQSVRIDDNENIPDMQKYTSKEVMLEENPRKQQKTRIFYQFSDEELADLTLKGLYDRNFRIPEIFMTSRFRVPVSLEMDVVKPHYENDTPLVFVSVSNALCLETNSEESGYDMRDVFPMQASKQLGLESEMETGVPFDMFRDTQFLDLRDEAEKKIIEEERIKREQEEQAKQETDQNQLSVEELNLRREADALYQKAKQHREELEQKKAERKEQTDEAVRIMTEELEKQAESITEQTEAAAEEAVEKTEPEKLRKEEEDDSWKNPFFEAAVKESVYAEGPELG